MQYLVIADVHANAAALAAVLDTADWDAIIFLGDIVVAGPEPVRSIELLADLDGVFLAGNHDRELLTCDPETRPDDPHNKWLTWTRKQLTPDHLAILREFEAPQSIATQVGRVALHHGDFQLTFTDIEFNGRLWPDSDQEVFMHLANRYDAPILLHGHSHIQFRTQVDGTHFVNPGSVGAPRLGQPVACYGMIETVTLHSRQQNTISTERVERWTSFLSIIPLLRIGNMASGPGHSLIDTIYVIFRHWLADHTGEQKHENAPRSEL